MINVIEPENELVKQFVDSIYVFTKSDNTLEFTAYPSINTPVGLLRNATINIDKEHVCITNTDLSTPIAIACNQFFNGIHLQYLQTVDEIAINFKPLGFSSFTNSKPLYKKIYSFKDWDNLLPDLFQDVFSTNEPNQQLFFIEKFLIKQYTALTDETILLKTLALLNETKKNYKMQEIADIVGVHYKQLYRSFVENIGCSPTHYRKLLKFRTSIISKIKDGDKSRLVDICYDHDYTDQAYFIKQFKELTGEKPTHFFKEVSSFGNDKVIFKMV